MMSDKTRMASSSLWLVASILFTLLSCLAVNALPKQNLHHHMTKREIEHYFGVDEHDKVPEYDITHPYQSNEQGEFVSYSMHSQTREKRDTRPQKSSFYKMKAFGTELHLTLKRNDHLMAPGMKVLRQHSDGTTTQHPAPENTYYLGHVASDPQSVVAVSNFGGLTGMVKTSRDTLFVHPLPTHLAKHVTNMKKDGTPHLVYRRSITENRGSRGTSEDEDGDEERVVLTSVKNQVVSNAMSDDFAKPVSKALEVALLYPPSLAAKYNASLYVYIGGVERFLMLLANMVFRMFQDPTIGRIKIVYVVTEIKMIQPSEYGFDESTSNGKIVNSIRDKVNKQKVPYDVFSFISNTLSGGGIANVGEACIRTTGNANREIGLQTASYIAHETAHNIGVGHDTGDCNQNYIMHEKLPSGENAAKWSSCSRTAVQNFLENTQKSHCLKNGPVNVTRLGTTLNDTLPGLKVDGDKQCELRNGPGWKRHETHQCHHFKCSFFDGSGTVVVGDGAAVVDGTNCGQDKGCFKGKCIVMDVGSVNGMWSDWSDYSQCSRPCEGIQFRTRRCIRHSNFAAPCRGQFLQYRVCNSKCGPDDKFDTPFWDQKCRERNPQSRSFLFGHCRIFCLSGNVASSLANNVDGYRYSSPNADNYENTVCIKGAGRPFGCDHVVDSTTQLDRCSVCGGNGNTCKLVQRVYTDNPDTSGPSNGVLIMELPIGTTNAVIFFKDFTKHRLGVQDGNGKYLVGYPLGNKRQTIKAAGAQIRYTPNKRKKLFKDSITVSLTATTEVLKIMYFKISRRTLNPGVEARFYVPTIMTSNGRPEDFEWRLSDWTGSSRTCPPGTRARNRRCVRKDDGTIAGDDACQKPIPAACEPMWTVLEWEKCSKTCGAGIRSRIVKCLEKVSEDNYRETNSCTAVKPTIITEPCNEFPCPAQWKIGEWSECSVTCGNGTQQRSVLCSRINETGSDCVIDDAFCQYQKPVSENKCKTRIPCPITACTSNPCLNGATCVDNGANDRYTCKCPQGFGGDQCQESIPACTSNPCLNGATCVDNGARDNYTCKCPQGFRGDRCQVSNFYEIGCFVYKTGVIPLLKDLTKQFDPQKTEPTVLKCAELAQEKGYKFFVLGLSGKCYSASNASEYYFKQGSGRKENCPNGVGAKRFVFAYTFDPLPAYEKLGCYFAVKKAKKSFRTKYIDLRKQFDQKDTTRTIERCLRIAISNGYKYFSVKNSGECWSDSQAAVRYNRLGKAKAGACERGVGLPYKKSMMVYRMKE